MTDDPVSWSEDDSATYRKLAPYAVPERERQLAIVAQLVKAVEADGPVLDLCCGDGPITAIIMETVPEVRVLAYDGSDSMLIETRKHVPNTDQLTTKVIELASHDWRLFDEPLRAVISSLAIHHLDDRRKQELFSDIHDALAPGGVFVLADIMEAVTKTGTQISGFLWDQETQLRALTIDGTLDGFTAFENAKWNYFHQPSDDFDKPSTLPEQLGWLQDAGFADVDVHWMVAGHAIISGWRR